MEQELKRITQGYSYLLIAREAHADGEFHYHVFVEYPNKRDIRNGRNFFHVPGTNQLNIQSARNATDVIKYVKKDGDFREFGTEPTATKTKQELAAELVLTASQGKKTNLKDILIETPSLVFGLSKFRGDLAVLSQVFSQAKDWSHPRGIWIYGPSGVGKSHNARLICAKLGYEIYEKPHSKWWDSYTD